MVEQAAVATLVQQAREGRQEAFDALVDRFSSLVWAVARSHRLTDADAGEVFQTTWLRFVEHLDRIRDPEALAGWLATTARRESLRCLRDLGRLRPTETHQLDRTDDTLPAPGLGMVTRERDRILWEAVEELNPRCQGLLRVLMADPPPAYEEVSAALDMPIGSIGPTRARCLNRLREILRSRGITTAADASA